MAPTRHLNPVECRDEQSPKGENRLGEKVSYKQVLFMEGAVSLGNRISNALLLDSYLHAKVLVKNINIEHRRRRIRFTNTKDGLEVS